MNVYVGVVLGVFLFSTISEMLTRRAFPRRDALSALLATMAGAILVTVAGLRWMVGTDYEQYTVNYPRYRDGVLEAVLEWNEPGIRLVALLASWVWDDPAMMLLLAAIVAVGLITRTLIRAVTPVAFVLLMFIFSGLWHSSFNGVRQCIAAAILLAGHRYIYNRRLWCFLLVVAGASAFHITALGGVLFYWVPRGKIRLSALTGIGLISILGVVYAEPLRESVFGLMGITDNPYALREVNPVRILIAVAPFLLYLPLRSREGSQEQWLYRNFAVVYAALAVALSTSAYLYRFTLYPLAFLPLALVYLTDFKDATLRQWVRLMLLLLYGAAWYLEVEVSGDLNHFTWLWQR